MTRAEKQEANLDTETKESAKLARPDDEDAPKPKNEAEAKKELDLLKANAKALKGDLAAAAETAANLAHLTKEAQARIDALSEERAQAKAKVEEMRYSGPGVGGSRRVVDEFDSKLSEASSKCEKNRKRFNRVSQLLVNAKAGIEHLFDRLENIKLDVPAPAQMSDETVGDILGICEQKLLKIVEGVREDEEEAVVTASSDELGRRLMSESNYEISPFNVRVPVAVESENEESEEEEEEDIAVEDEVLDREMLKDVSQTLLDKQTSKRRRARKSTESTTTKQAAVPKPPAAAKSARGQGTPRHRRVAK